MCLPISAGGIDLLDSAQLAEPVCNVYHVQILCSDFPLADSFRTENLAKLIATNTNCEAVTARGY